MIVEFAHEVFEFKLGLQLKQLLINPILFVLPISILVVNPISIVIVMAMSIVVMAMSIVVMAMSIVVMALSVLMGLMAVQLRISFLPIAGIFLLKNGLPGLIK